MAYQLLAFLCLLCPTDSLSVQSQAGPGKYGFASLVKMVGLHFGKGPCLKVRS